MDEKLGLVVAGIALCRTFRVTSLAFILGSLGSLCKISDVQIPKSFLELSRAFIPSQPNFVRTLHTTGKYTIIMFFGKFKKNVAPWNFNMGVNAIILKCGNSSERLIIQRNRWNFLTHRVVCTAFKVIFLFGTLSSLWGHSVNFGKCPMLY